MIRIKMKSQYLILLMFFLGIKLFFGQVTGKIIDVNSKYPLEYATAALYNQEDGKLITGVITDINGVFTIAAVKKGSYYLETSFLGYENKIIKDIQVKYRGAKNNLGTISLTIGGNELDEVVVKGERSTVINKIDRQVYDAKVFQNSQGGSATDVIKNLPSVTVNGLGDISVRGSSGFVMLLNGKPVQGNAAKIMSQLPANAIERVELITAPSAKYDPEGKAGLLNIITKKGAANGAYTQINVRGGFPSVEDYDNKETAKRYGADITYNVRTDKWNISAGASYQRNDVNGRREGNVFTIVDNVITRFPSDGERGFDEENYSGRFTVDFTPNKVDDFSVGFYAGIREKARTADILYNNSANIVGDDANKIFELTYFNENLRIRKGDFVLGSFDYGHSFKNESKLSASFLYEYTLLGGPTTNRNLNYPNTNSLIQDESNTNDNPLNGIRAQLDYAWKPFSFGTIETGYQYRHLDHKGDFFYGRRTNFSDDFTIVPQFSSEIDLVRTIHSGYVQLNGKKEKWEYAAGVRLEVMDRDLDLRDKTNTFDEQLNYKYEKLFPSASVQYSINEDTKIKAAYSKRVERPSTFKLNPFREREHSETLEQGDKNLLPEFIDVVELGITKKFNASNSVFATTYFRNVENLVNRVNQIYDEDPIDPLDSRFDNVVLDRIYSNVGEARVFGLEFGGQFKLAEKWSNFIGGNIYNYTIDGEYDGRSVDSNATIFSLNANSTYAFSDTSSLQFTLNYISRRKTAQGEDSEFYLPNLTYKKSFLDNRLVATVQWLNMDLGLLRTNEQRITTRRTGEFFTTTNYVLEVDMFVLNLSYSFNKTKNRSKFIESEFGKKEF